MTVVVIQSSGIGTGGTDYTLDAVDWDPITVTDTATGYEDNSASAQTLAGIDNVVSLKAAWTSTSGNPAKGQWFKNGVAVQSPALTPVYVNAIVGDVLFFKVYVGYTYPSGNYDTGTVTVTNESDGGATLDTFTFAAQFVYSGSGSSNPGDAVHEGGQPNAN